MSVLRDKMMGFVKKYKDYIKVLEDKVKILESDKN